MTVVIRPPQVGLRSRVGLGMGGVVTKWTPGKVLLACPALPPKYVTRTGMVRRVVPLKEHAQAWLADSLGSVGKKKAEADRFGIAKEGMVPTEWLIRMLPELWTARHSPLLPVVGGTTRRQT